MKPEVKKKLSYHINIQISYKKSQPSFFKKKKTNKKSQFVKYKHNFNFRKVDNFLQKKKHIL